MKNVLILTLALSLAACSRSADDAPTADTLVHADALSTSASADVITDGIDAFDKDVRSELTVDPMMAFAVPMSDGPSAQTSPVEPDAAPVSHPTEAFTLRNGESLAHFARWAGLPVEDLAELSNLELDGSYAVGTEVLIPSDIVDIETFASLRQEYWTQRVDRYVESRGGELATETYKVRTGDSAWTIARDGQGIPMWILEAYNPGVDLGGLRPGQKLSVPVLADIVVDAETADTAHKP